MRLAKSLFLLLFLLAVAAAPAAAADKKADKKSGDKPVAGPGGPPATSALPPVFDLPDVMGQRFMVSVSETPSLGVFLSVRFAGPGGGMFSGERDAITEKVVSRLKSAGIEIAGRNLPGETNVKATEILVDVTGVPSGPSAVFFVQMSVVQPVVTLSSLAAVGSPVAVLQRAVSWTSGVAMSMEKPSKEMVEKAVMDLAERYVAAVEKGRSK